LTNEIAGIAGSSFIGYLPTTIDQSRSKVTESPVYKTICFSVVLLYRRVFKTISVCCDLTYSKMGSPKKAKKRARPSTHPTCSVMVQAAIRTLKERRGSSLPAIKKYIAANYKCDVAKLNTHIKNAIRTGVAKGTLVQVKGQGASGSFRLGTKSVDAAQTKAKRAKAAQRKKAAAAKRRAKRAVAKAKRSAAKAKRAAAKKAKRAAKKAAKKAKKPKKKSSKKKKTAKPKRKAASKKRAAPKKKARKMKKKSFKKRLRFSKCFNTVCLVYE